MAETVLKTIIQVRRDTAANWETNKAFIPDAGEPCMNLDTGVVVYGNGVDTYEALVVAYEANKAVMANHYEGVKQDGESDNDVIDRVLTELAVEAKKDDIFVVKSLISEGKYSYTAFVYNGTAWAAMDGNYSAENVYLTGAVQLSGAYTKVGNVTKSSEAAVEEYDWDGMNVKEMFEAILAKILYPTKPTPSVSLSLTNSGAKEIGTTITPSFKVTYDPKTYAYGSTSNDDAGSGTYAAPGEVTITLADGTTLTGTMTGNGSGSVSLTISGASMVVDASTSYYGSKVACAYGDGAVPLTNTGAEYADAQVGAGTATNDTDTSKITHYREGCFYGTVSVENFTVDSITSDMIRGLSGKLKANYSAKNNLAYTVPVGATAIIIACPAGKTGPTSVLNTTVNAKMWGDNFKKTTISVGGADATSSDIGSYATDYDVYYYVPANAYASTAALQIDLGA